MHLTELGGSMKLASRKLRQLIREAVLKEMSEPPGIGESMTRLLKTYIIPYKDRVRFEIEDDGERIKAIFEEILKIKEKPLDEIHEWYISIKDILAHNRKLFLSYGDNHWLRCWTKHIVEIYND